MFTKTSVGATLFAAGASAGSLKDINHVVLFMQENRAFDHYFGTMAGVRGFADPNVQVNSDGRNTFQQLCNSPNASQLTPFYWNYLGGDYDKATQCNGAGDNSWFVMHEAYAAGKNNQWPAGSPYSMAYFKRKDIPTHWDVAEGWTVGDMYQEAVLAATDPNRIVWMSGTVNNPGSPNNLDGTGGMILDNTATPGCEKGNLNCFPFTWKTVPEYWQDANATWQVYQDADNFEDNMLAYFKQYQDASNDTSNPLTKFGNSYIGLDKFFDDARSGNLPEVSIIVGPAELAEHPPFMPSDGAWLIQEVVNAVTQGESAKDTALIISYDEGGGFADHVTPFTAPYPTQGEWINDPYGYVGETPVGPGFRIPLMIVSPWTRGGNVFTEPADHTSQILFVEKWLEAKGYENVESKEVPTWRRQHMSNLVNAFDFSNPDYSLPSIHEAQTPLRDESKPDPVDGLLGALYGNYIGSAKCQSDYKNRYPPVPYGDDNANADISKTAEEGFKAVRGALTEGRYLTFEKHGFALTNVANALVFTKASSKHDDIKQRFVLHQQGDATSNVFTISSAKNGHFVQQTFTLGKNEKHAAQFTIQSQGTGNGYTISMNSGKGLDVNKNGHLLDFLHAGKGFDIFSVTYHS